MTFGLRERPSVAGGASPTAAPVGALRRTLIFAVVIGAFLSFIEAFGSGGLPLAPRTVLMIAVATFAALAGFVCFRLICRSAWAAARWWRLGAIAALVITPPVTIFVWAALRLAWGRPAAFLPVVIYNLPGSFVTCLFFCLWAAYSRARRLEQAGALAPAPAAMPRFLDRLPPKLRGADLWAVEAEDHYLRLHTSSGQDLILMRLSDAIAELDGLEGAQTHRSWWVARAAISAVERADGRATLTLKNGARAPVSRAHARALRARGWL